MTENRIKELESEIKRFAQAYYSGESLISDDEFDKLVDELRELSPKSEVLNKTGWGFEPEGRKILHRYGLHIGSLSKIHSVSEIPASLMSRYTQVRISAKLDGLSVVTYYENGLLTLALTRGNGTHGIDVTDKILRMHPNLAKLKTEFTGAIRGEVIMPQETWDNNPEYLKIQEENESANPRNFASGILNRGYLSEELEDLRYVCYKVLYSESDEFGQDIQSVEDFFNYNSINIVPNVICFQDSYTDEDFKKLYEGWCKSYPCDGLVLSSLDEGLIYNEIAYKFQAETKEVVVTDVTWSATRTGRLAPRIWFDSVELSGAMVKKATAFNAAFIRDNKIGVGAVVEVRRSGEVIPDIVKVVTPVENVDLPSTCPNCGSGLVWSGVDLKCESEDEAQLGYRFVSVLGEIDGAGWSLYSEIVNSLNLTSLDNLVSVLESFKVPGGVESAKAKVYQNVSGEVTRGKVDKILDKLSSSFDPVGLLVACNIPGLSWTTGQILLSGYPEFIPDVIKGTYTMDKVLEIKGLGWSMVSTISKYINRLVRIFKAVEVSQPKVEDPKEVNFKVAITGALSMKRADFDALLSSKGIIQSSNFKEIKYLITNHPESTSSKMKKAKDNGVEIISEEEFTKKYL